MTRFGAVFGNFLFLLALMPLAPFGLQPPSLPGPLSAPHPLDGPGGSGFFAAQDPDGTKGRREPTWRPIGTVNLQQSRGQPRAKQMRSHGEEDMDSGCFFLEDSLPTDNLNLGRFALAPLAILRLGLRQNRHRSATTCQAVFIAHQFLVTSFTCYRQGLLQLGLSIDRGCYEGWTQDVVLPRMPQQAWTTLFVAVVNKVALFRVLIHDTPYFCVHHGGSSAMVMEQLESLVPMLSYLPAVEGLRYPLHIGCPGSSCGRKKLCFRTPWMYDVHRDTFTPVEDEGNRCARFLVPMPLENQQTREAARAQVEQVFFTNGDVTPVEKHRAPGRRGRMLSQERLPEEFLNLIDELEPPEVDRKWNPNLEARSWLSRYETRRGVPFPQNSQVQPAAAWNGLERMKEGRTHLEEEIESSMSRHPSSSEEYSGSRHMPLVSKLSYQPVFLQTFLDLGGKGRAYYIFVGFTEGSCFSHGLKQFPCSEGHFTYLEEVGSQTVQLENQMRRFDRRVSIARTIY